MPWEGFLQQIRALPEGQLWRHNQAGDIQDPGTKAGRESLSELVEANRGRRGWTYTHHPVKAAATVQAVKAATANGFTVNVSTESIAAADAAVSRGLRAVVVVPSDDQRRIWRSPDGNPVVTCPEQVHGISCDRCRLCHGRPQDVIVAFRAHGTGRRRVDAAVSA